MKWSSVFRWIQEEYNRSLAVLERSIICDLYMFIAVRLVTWVHLCCKTRTVSLPSINFRVYGYKLFTQTIWIWKPWERVNLVSTTLVKESLSEFKKQSLYVKNIQLNVSQSRKFRIILKPSNRHFQTIRIKSVSLHRQEEVLL